MTLKPFDFNGTPQTLVVPAAAAVDAVDAVDVVDVVDAVDARQDCLSTMIDATSIFSRFMEPLDAKKSVSTKNGC